MIHLLRLRATSEQMREMLEAWELTVKLAVDIKREVLVGGGHAHSDCEQVLLADGSQQEDIWGVSYLPEVNHIRYDSMVNLRPRQGLFNTEIQDPAVRDRIAKLIQQFLEGV